MTCALCNGLGSVLVRHPLEGYYRPMMCACQAPVGVVTSTGSPGQIVTLPSPQLTWSEPMLAAMLRVGYPRPEGPVGGATPVDVPLTQPIYPATQLEMPVSVPVYPATQLELPVSVPVYPATQLEMPVSVPVYPATQLELPVSVPVYPATQLEMPVSVPVYPATQLELPMAAPAIEDLNTQTAGIEDRIDALISSIWARIDANQQACMDEREAFMARAKTMGKDLGLCVALDVGAIAKMDPSIATGQPAADAVQPKTVDLDEATMFDEFPAGTCLMCGKAILADKAYGPKDAGTIQMGFGYGSHAHDVLAYDGFICDACAMPFREKMLAQTRVRLAENRKRLIAEGVEFTDLSDSLEDL